MKDVQTAVKGEFAEHKHNFEYCIVSPRNSSNVSHW